MFMLLRVNRLLVYGLALILTLLTSHEISASLYALPASESAAPRTVHMMQQWIPMPDGVRLSATLYMPDNLKAGEKFPALLEYLPYRKDDATAARDYPLHHWFAAHGYVSVRVDIRGFGASEGTPTDREYSEQEQLDGEQVIAWLAAQPWSTGNVGMFGISWGGFNSIQMAMRHPPALKAILAVDATEQLFHDDS
jgi:putative CocE/NonD family hydrolase